MDRGRWLWAACLAFSWAGLQATECDTKNGWLPHDGSCYFLSNNVHLSEYNWHQARQYCLQNGGELASIHSQAEMNFIISMADEENYAGTVWIGLNQLENRTADYKWTDGTEADYDSWAASQPVRNGLQQCVYSQVRHLGGCFKRLEEINLIKNVIKDPYDVPTGCKKYGYFSSDGITQCEEKCGADPTCDAYTYFIWGKSEMKWAGECFGCEDHMVSEQIEDEATASGTRTKCDPLGGDIWFSGNCGEQRGFMCKKNPGSNVPATVPPTPQVPGYCPKGYRGIGNKCYKLVTKTDSDGVTWEEALKLCRQDSHIGADLASLSTPEEQAAVSLQLTEHAFGYWIGYNKFDGKWVWTDNSDPTYTNWGEGYLYAYNCAVVMTQPPLGHWEPLYCGNKRGYICEAYKDINNVQSTPGFTPPHKCADGYTAYWYGCYRLELEPKTWSSAERHCNDLGGHIASIHDEAENAFIFGAGNKHLPMWIGLEKVSDEGFTWSDGWPELFTKWGAGEPYGGDGCVSMETDSKWNDTLCSHEYPYVCKIANVPKATTPAPREGDCPSSMWEEWGGHCYYFSRAITPHLETSAWKDVLTMCRKHAGPFHNATIASVHDKITNDWMYHKLLKQNPYSNGAWIGLSRPDKASPWEWDDGSPLNYDNWAPGEPNNWHDDEMCTELMTNRWPGLWNDVRCTSYKPYVCRAEKMTALSTPSPPPVVPGDCPDEEWVPYAEHCYLFKPNAYGTWDSAQTTCKKLGGHGLAVIRSFEENYFIWQNMLEESVSPYRSLSWIGLRQKDDSGPWQWYDQSVVSFENWEENAPDNSMPCGEYHSGNGKWTSYKCDERRGYICQYTKELPPTTTPLSTEPSTSNHQSSTPDNANTPSGGGGMSGGVIAGVVIGVLLAFVIIGALGFFGYTYYIKRRAIPKDNNNEFSHHTYDNFKN